MNVKQTLNIVAKVFTGVFVCIIFLSLIIEVYVFGYWEGKYEGQMQYYDDYGIEAVEKFEEIAEPTVVPTQVPINSQPPVAGSNNPNNMPPLRKSASWGGPDLWEAVNARRIELGVNPLNQKDNLCTIASIRLNELLELGKLDGHEGFTTMTERRPDLAYIFENYSTVAEFLAAGGSSAAETVSLWENSLGHKKIVTGGEYVWGCIYAQDSFAVAITAF